MRDGSADFKKPSIAASGMWFLCSAKEHQLSRDLQRSLDEHERCVRVGLATVSVALCKRVLELRIRIGQRRIRPQSVGISNALGKAWGGHGRPWDPGAGPDAVVAAAWSVRVGCRCPRLGRVRQARDASHGRVAASTSGLSLRRATSRCRGAHCCPGCAWCCSLGRCVCDGRAGAAQAGKSCPASRARPRGGGCGSIPR
jgi:hypothetical protein